MRRSKLLVNRQLSNYESDHQGNNVETSFRRLSFTPYLRYTARTKRESHRE